MGPERGGGRLVRDASPRGLSGAFQGAVAWAPGAFGPCLSFPGASSSDNVTIASATQLEITGKAVTVAAWVRPLGAFGGIVDKTIGGATNAQFLLFMQDGLPRFRVVDNPSAAATPQPNGNQYTAIGDATLVSGRWTRLVGTYDGHLVRLYVNGAPAATSSAATFDIKSAPGMTLIGSLGSGIYPFHGAIDMVSIHARAWTRSQVLRDFADSFAPYRAASTLRPGTLAAATESPSSTSPATFRRHRLPPFARRPRRRDS